VVVDGLRQVEMVLLSVAEVAVAVAVVIHYLL
jgi:hypothetical protein